MEKPLIYANIVNSNSIIEIILKICYVCIAINLTIWIFEKFKNNKLKEKQSEDLEPLQFGKIEMVGSIIMVGLLMIVCYFILRHRYLITLLSIPSTILAIYIVYIKPMIKIEKDLFEFNYYSYGIMLTVALNCILFMDYKDYFLRIPSDGVAQVMTILILLFQIYTSVYCLTMNVYFVIKNFGKMNVEIISKKYNLFLNKVYEILGFDSIKLAFNLTHYILNLKNKKCIFVILCFIVDVIWNLFLYLVSCFFSFVLSPLLFFSRWLVAGLVRLTKTNENYISYGISKFTSVVSIIFVYVLLQMGDVFQERIISVYEFFSTAVLIPIVFDGLTHFREKKLLS